MRKLRLQLRQIEANDDDSGETREYELNFDISVGYLMIDEHMTREGIVGAIADSFKYDNRLQNSVLALAFALNESDYPRVVVKATLIDDGLGETLWEEYCSEEGFLESQRAQKERDKQRQAQLELQFPRIDDIPY